MTEVDLDELERLADLAPWRLSSEERNAAIFALPDLIAAARERDELKREVGELRGLLREVASDLNCHLLVEDSRWGGKPGKDLAAILSRLREKLRDPDEPSNPFERWARRGKAKP